ncbi:Disease resistance protein [Melia azedarach]|uniref:Disease resistance protein n=1 Tax=Melia azedarach TaxID=155640 RepID=A0ACC1YDJ2_MELAZ|nr:Disease resistance protein [Melia azedarach]
MADIIVNVAVEVAKCVSGPIGRRSSYLQNYASNVENLNNGVEKLTDARESMQNKVDRAQRKGENVEKIVEKWLVNVEKKIDEAEKLIKEEEEANKKCFSGLCPNLKKRYRLSKKAVMMEKEVVGLKEEAEKFHQISYRAVPEEAWLFSVKGYEAFDSRLPILTNIRNAVTDPDISIVGVYGMGGIGKTTLVKEVARQAKKEKLFDEVIFTELSQSTDTKIIQGEIAEKLGLELREETESGKANRLCERLKNQKKILVVLDNIWKHLDLENVGIPYGDDHNGCKLLLIARDLDVLLKTGSKNNFPISVLNDEEAWRLFKKMAGDDVENLELKSTAMYVAKECGGLPVAITTIARALRNKSVPEWKNALRELRTPSSGNFEGVPAEAYSTIELSYKYLKSEQLKKTFLLCSLMSNPNVYTSNLFKYGMSLGMFQGINTMEDARNKLYALVHELKASCLLLATNSSTELAMHDVVCDVAISIACRDQHAFVVRNEDLWKWPDKEVLGKCSAISLTDSSMHEIPEGLECPQLEFLSMEFKYSSVKIPENFFAGMRKVKVVDLKNIRLTSLPSSLDVLTNLQTLCLDQGVFQDVATIGKLKSLEILSFVGSDIVQLPRELGQLTKLRLLDLSGCSNLKVIAPHVISCLTRLEELYMSNCYVEWEIEGSDGERSNASLNELMHLPYLSALELDIKNENHLPEGLLSKKLARFRISIGNGLFKNSISFYLDYWFGKRYHFDEQETSRILKLKLSSIGICSENLYGVKDVEYLYLDKLQGVKNVAFELDTEGFRQLKHLYVQNNPEFLCIVDSMERIPYDAFPLLESLTLYSLINLEKICRNNLRAESFNKLSTIVVNNCKKLRSIFSLSTTECLPRLQKIVVDDCGSMEEIFAIGGENDAKNSQVQDKIEFSQLTSLVLISLPQLTCFCKAIKTQENLITRSSSQLFSGKVLLPNLEDLELYQINVEKIWHNQLPTLSSSNFRNLTQLIVRKCDKLRYIFSSSMVRSFEQLQHLWICYCSALEEIIAMEEGAEMATSFVFPRVTNLVLVDLPELRCFYPGLHTSEWPALQRLEVRSRDKVTMLGSEIFSFNQESQIHKITEQQPLLLVEKVFLNLEVLSVGGKDAAIISQCNFPKNFLSKIKRLDVVEDESESFPLVLLEKFDNLEKLGFFWSSYKEIFSSGQVEKHVGNLAKIKSIKLNGLSDLNQLWEENSKMDSIFQSLEILDMSYCENLTNLLPCSLSFQHLKELNVGNCKKLVNLVTSTIAKGLVQLVKMTVCGCSGMTEVVAAAAAASEGDNIVFGKLQRLTLRNLESLASFCSGTCTFKFSSLEHLVVIDCPKMKIFSRGELTTPRVRVKYGNEAGEWRWGSDLNTAIQQLHAQKLLQRSSSSPSYSSSYSYS